VIREGYNMKSKGYGFISFMDPFEAARAIREKNGKYIGNR
jgi:RNA recognition motif-containing protein